MFKVLIIDDEVLARVGLKSMVSWERIGCRIVGDANNGEEALKIIEETNPDIIITDIRMPVMDGIEMIRKLKETGKNIKTIVLSAYDEFNLVKEAMKLGAEEYLIKLDITPDKLSKTVEAVCQKISNEAEENKQKIIVDMHARMNKEAAKKEFLKKVIDKMIEIPKDIYERMIYLDIKLDLNNILCLVLKINEIVDISKYESKEDRGLLDFCIENVASEVANDFYTAYVFNYSQDIFVIVFSIDDESIKNTGMEKVKVMGNRLISTLSKYINVNTSIGVSDFHSSITEINKAFKEACVASEKCSLLGTGNVLLYNDTLSGTYDLEQRQNTDIIIKAREYILDHFSENIKLSDISEYLNLSHCYFSTVFKKITGESFIDYVTKLKILEAQKLLKKGRYRIYEVAEMLGYENAYYFSRVFKKITGNTPKEYIKK